MIIDVHSHLDYKSFEKDLPEVIQRAKEAGICAIINNGLNHKSNIKTLELAKKYPLVKAALGFYPTDALEVSEETFLQELDFIRKNKNKIVALGEIGMDFYHTQGKEKEQEKIFLRFLELSEELKLPLIIHSRKAEKTIVEILERFQPKKVIMHCFSGNTKLIKRCEEQGWFFTVPCNVVFSQHFQNLVKQVSINQILTETDAPFLSPIKGKRNEPKNIVFTINKIAEIKGLDKEEVKRIIFMNYKKIF